MSHSHKLAQSRHRFQSGLLEFISGDKSGLTHMHAALAPVVMMGSKEHTEFFFDAVEYIESVQFGVWDGRIDHAKLILPLIDKQLRSLTINGQFDADKAIELRDAVDMSRALNVEPTFNLNVDALHDFSEFWNDGGFEDPVETGNKLSAMRDIFSNIPKVCGLLDALVNYVAEYNLAVGQNDGNDFAEKIESFRLDVATAVLLMRDYFSAPSVAASSLLSAFSLALKTGNKDYFAILNSVVVWRKAWNQLSEHALKVLNEASSAVDSFDTEGAVKLYRKAHAVVSPFIAANEVCDPVSKEDIAHLQSLLQERASVDLGDATGKVEKYIDNFKGAKNSAHTQADAPSVQALSEELDFSFDDEIFPETEAVSVQDMILANVTTTIFLKNEDGDSSAGLGTQDELNEVVSEPAVAQPINETSMDDGVSQSSDDAIDPEMVGIFIEEAREVISALREQVPECRKLSESGGDSIACLSDIRRGVHTLKGSGRMVGQIAMGEVAWSVENALNKIIDEDRSIDGVILDLIGDFTLAFSRWVDELEVFGASAIDGSEAIIVRAKDVEAHTDRIEANPSGDVLIGSVKIALPLFNIAKNEMATHVRKLSEHSQVLHAERNGPIVSEFVRAAHTLAGVSRTSGVLEIGQLASKLEDWLTPRQSASFDMNADRLDVVMRAVDALDTQVHDFSEMRMPAQHEDIVARLAETQDELMIDRSSMIDLTSENVLEREFLSDDLDIDLLPVFIEEAATLEDEISAAVKAWKGDISGNDAPRLLMRLLHTMKGSARMVGAMQIGEIAHRLENELRLFDRATDKQAVLDDVEAGFDEILSLVDDIASHKGHQADDPLVEVAPMVVITSQLKVPADVLDTLVNESGEIGAARQRIEAEMHRFEGSLAEMDKGIASLRRYLRDIEIYAESQIQSRITTQDEHFDPLEFDRFTGLQEVTRFLNESIYDVQTVQQGLLSNLSETYSSLAMQQKLNREHQQALMSIRMVPMMSIAERLYRTVRQGMKDLGKRVNLDIIGGTVDIDAGILEKMTAPIEHMIRNSIVHGIESDRSACGKDDIGEIKLEVKYESNEVIFSMWDDGAGIDVPKLVKKAILNGLIAEDHRLSAEEQVELVFLPGISTASELTEIAGRGVGMDIVKSSVKDLGGRVSVQTRTGGGVRFTCRIPATISLMHVMIVKSAEETYAIPSQSIRHILHVEPQNMSTIMNESLVRWKNDEYILHSVSQIMESGSITRDESAPTQFLLMEARDGQRIALQVDAVQQQREVAVKRLGVQLSGMPGLVGATILGNGEVVMIVNPASLIDNRQKSTFVTTKIVNPVRVRPLVMVVDDSLTVRKVSTKLLESHGYDVVTATDGQDALSKLDDVDPDMMLLDIEMPRMNGFELAESLRMSERFKNLPIVMITSRTADKHREHALSIGVNHYMGKPFKETLLLEVLGGYRVNNLSNIEQSNNKETEYA